MRPLGPFGPRRVAVAASGGADSTALALLAAAWGQATALIVDHGLRPGSAAEAALTRDRLAARGIAARVLTLSLPPGPGAPARARTGRFAALTAACVAAGVVDLLLGHHAGDQAETIALRRAAGSGAPGLAGMAAVASAGPVRLLRPMLAIPPQRLRATLAAAGMQWVEDPTNADHAYARARLRRSLAGRADDDAPALGEARRRAEALPWPAEVALDPSGVARLPPDPAPDMLRAAIWAVSGRPYPPSAAAVARLRGPATLHGVRLLRHAGNLLVAREPAAMGPPVPARPGAVWDGRFAVLGCDWPGAALGALGPDAAGLRRRSGLPAAVLRTLPAIRCGNVLSAVPHLAYPTRLACAAVRIVFRPARALAGSPFVPAGGAAGMHSGQGHTMSFGDAHTDRTAPGAPGFEDWIV